jgi:hypothetical protein
MEKNIIALLDINLRVIIPEFGAFIIRQNEPKVVVFNEFLRYDDGLLIDYIAKIEGIEKEIAGQRIADFVEEATKVLDNGDTFIIKGLGSLIKDSSGKITFTQAPAKEKITKEIAGQDTGSKKSEQVQEPIKEIELESSEEIVIEPKTEKVKEPVPKTRAKRSTKTSDKKTQDKKIGEVHLPEPAESTVVREQTLVNPPEEVKPSDTVESTTIPVKRTINQTNQILIWILVILFVNAAILAWFVYKDDFKRIFRKNKIPAVLSDSVIQRLSDSLMEAASDTSLIFDEASDLTDALPTTYSSEIVRYYIIAGSFVDEANADALVDSLTKRGFKAEKFIRTGNRYYVAFASFSDKESAYKELKRIREEVEPKAWVSTVSNNQ